jgi:hypothetical protein
VLLRSVARVNPEWDLDVAERSPKRPEGTKGGRKKCLASNLGCGTLWTRLMLLYRLWNDEESGREVTLAAFFYVRPKTAKLCEGLGKAPDSSI